jgi:hypothetical protein
VSRQDFQALARQQSTFPVVAAWVRVPTVALAGPQSSAFADVEAVTGDYFAMVGLRAAHGRLIQRADDEPGAAHVLVLSEPAWHQHFEGDPGVIGRTVRLGGRPVEIVGVAPAGFRGLTAVFAGQYAGWVPASFLQSSADPVWQAWATRSTLNVGARLLYGETSRTPDLVTATVIGITAPGPLDQQKGAKSGCRTRGWRRHRGRARRASRRAASCARRGRIRC